VPPYRPGSRSRSRLELGVRRQGTHRSDRGSLAGLVSRHHVGLVLGIADLHRRQIAGALEVAADRSTSTYGRHPLAVSRRRRSGRRRAAARDSCSTGGRSAPPAIAATRSRSHLRLRGRGRAARDVRPATSSSLDRTERSDRSRHSLLYSSWRRYHPAACKSPNPCIIVSLRPPGARSSHWYMPQRPSNPRTYAE
jgi:hypothetical protein